LCSSLKRVTINITRQIVKIYKNTHCKIDSIELTSNEYLISFYYVGKRQIFIKSATQIRKNKFLLNEFSPDEAALIGLYASLTYNNKKLNSKRNNK
jgi:hypothetical protein